MFTLGIILLVLGSILKVWFRLNHRIARQSLTPRPVLLRMSALEDIDLRKKRGVFDANILLLIGTILVLVTAVFN